jgi:large subunit ribosomal protein L9
VKVVFIEDVPDVALAGETKDVADGYGRNYLLPKKLAVLADSAASNILKTQMKQVLVKRAQAKAEMEEIAARLDGTEITIRAKAGEKDRLYGSVTAADIAAELGKIAGQDIDKRKIDLEEPIRQLGVHEVTLRFSHDINATIKVLVEAEEAAPEAGEKEAKEEKKPRTRRAKKAQEEAVAAEEAEVKAEEAEIEGEKLVLKLEEPEVAEVKAEETETKVEKPKARKKSTKKSEEKVEEKESGE